MNNFEIFCAFILWDYNTITDLSYKKTRWLTNKRRNNQQKNNRWLNRNHLSSRLIDDYEETSQWLESFQKLRKKEKWKWLLHDHLLSGETNTSKVCIDFETEDCFKMWFVEMIMLKLSHTLIQNFSMIEKIDWRLCEKNSDSTKSYTLNYFLQNEKRKHTSLTEMLFCFSRFEAQWIWIEATNHIVQFQSNKHNILLNN